LDRIEASRLRVVGRVQRVGYRRYVLEKARQLGLKGYIKNEADDTVTILAQGPREQLASFLELVKSPPPPAYVEQVTVEEAKPNPRLKHFRIRYGPLTEELQEGFGAMQSIFMEYWREFKDYRGEFRDYRTEFRDYREEFRDYREEFREFARRTDHNFKLILDKYGEISEKLTTILNTLLEESRKTREMLDILMRDSKETRVMLSRALELLERAIKNR
jgi:acylphosphatase